MIRYRLSNRQRKELLVRNSAIRVAIPVHPIDIDTLDAADASQLRQWAAARLDGIEAREVRTAELVDLFVVLCGPADGLTGVLGAISDAPPSEDTLSVIMTCIVVDLARSTSPRHVSDQVQWPGSAVSPRREYPARKEAATDGQE